MADLTSVNLVETEREWRNELQQAERRERHLIEMQKKAADRRAEIARRLEALEVFKKGIQGQGSMPLPETSASETGDDDDFKAMLSNVWQRSRREQRAIVTYIEGAFPQFVRIDAEMREKLGLAEGDPISGLISGLAQICKHEGFSLDRLIETKRKSVGDKRPTFYRLRSKAASALREVIEESAR